MPDVFIGRRIGWLICLALLPALLAAPRHAPAQAKVDFNRDIRPILSNKCFACHGPDEKHRKTKMRLDTQDGARTELESGDPLIVPGKSSKSELFQRVSSDDPGLQMPPDEEAHLTEAQVALIKRWIDEGGQIESQWAFQKPVRRPLPDVKHADLAPTAIDRFVVARLESEGLTPSPEADKETLIRRVTLDLTGLPPTLEEIDAFLADNSPNAYEKVVDRLLASPHYGEQMARYWLDAARYGDTHGLHLDNERSVWPYRDWVIKAYNDNKRFDQFTIEQLAGDLLPNVTLEQRVATGFNRCNVTTSEGGAIEEEFRVRYAIDRVETTSTVWLGLTLGCAVCHEHKFDPVTQKEFYQLFAYFNNLTESGLDGNALLPPPVVKLPTPVQTQQLQQYDQQIAETEQSIQSALAKIEYTDVASPPAAGSVGGEPKKIEPADSLSAWIESQRALEKSGIPDNIFALVKLESDKRSDDQQRQLRQYFLEHVYSGTRAVFDPLHNQLRDLRKARQEFDNAIPASLVMEDRPEPRKAYVLVRGAYDKRGDEVVPQVPAVIPPALPADAQPNRLALAKWLVDPEQPLTSRVTVNRFWQQCFGTGLVKTAEDFGSQGEWPSHPELLDWLACEFIDSGWDVKHMMKLIVMSRTYSQTSRVTPELLKHDPDNRLLARGPRFRMDAEMVRDNALATSGLLVQTIGGKSVRPYQPSGLWEAVAYPTSTTAKFVRDEGPALYRRSMYTFWKRTSPPPSMTLFDAPSRESCEARRARTNTPMQALTLLNDEQFVEAARKMAERILLHGGSTVDDRLTYAFRLATARKPNAEEIDVIKGVFRAHLDEFRASPAEAEKLVAVGAAPRNAALDVPELAAWMMIANLILNLDETMTKG